MSKYKELFLPQPSKSLPQKFSDILQASSHNAKRLFHELLSLSLHQEINIDVFFSIFDLLYKDNSSFIASIIVDLLWLSGFSLSHQDKDDKKPKAEDPEVKVYASIVNTLLAKKVISKSSLIEKLEETTLSLCGIVPDLASFRAKITRINTEHFYEQKKYNLLREESEGFSKLISLLFSFGSLHIESKEEMELILDKVICLIGFFDLDPTRVVDLIIEAFIVFPFNTNYLWMFNIINLKALPHIIGFKLEKNEVKDNMFIVIAQCIKFGLVKMEDVIQHLKPSFSEMEVINSSNVDKVMNYSKGALIDKISNELRANSALMSIEDTAMNVNMTKQTASNFVNFNEVIAEAIGSDDSNQLLKLLNGLVKVKDKYHSELLHKVIQNYYDPLQSKTLMASLTQLLGWMIKGLYSQYQLNTSLNETIHHEGSGPFYLPLELKGEESFEALKSFDEMMKGLPQVMKLLSLGLAYDQLLFQKILVIISKQSLQTLLTYEKEITFFITEDAFPCLSLIDPTPSLVNLIWKTVSQYDYNKRYAMYNEWHAKVYTSHPFLYLKYIVVYREIIKWQKALSKENQRQHGRILGIISNSNPLLVFDNIIRLLISYENQIAIFMQTLSFCSSLSYDIITFIICKIIADPNKEKIDTKSCSINPWFKNFVYFIGCFYKKYHTAEINGLLIYIFGKFKQETIGIEIYTLKELIEKMSGIQTQELFSESNFLAECGGIHLYLESINLNKDFKYFKRPTQVLIRFFTQDIGQSEGNKDESLPFTLSILTLFLIKKRNIIFSNRETSVKLMSFLYDQFQYIFIQLLTFLYFYLDKDFFSKLFLNVSPERLISQFYINPMDVFQLVRNTLKPLYDQTELEYNSNIVYFSKLFDQYQENITKALKPQVESSYIEKDNLIEDIYKPIWTYISPELYYIFNVLDLKDIFFPMAQYETELDKNEKEKEHIAHSMTDEADSKTRKEYEKLASTIENLQKEVKQYKAHSEQVLAFLGKKTSLLDSISQINKKNIPQYLIQYLFYPRLILSKKDAIYTAQLLSILISLKIPMLNVFDLIRKVIKSIIPCILCVSECEALNIGYFFNELFKLIRIWQEEKYWNSKCSNNPCFSRSLDVIQTVELSDFKKAIVCILLQMTGTFQLIFDSDNYMNCRNAISVLSLITAYYPSTKESATDIINAIDKNLPKFKEYEDSIIMKRYMDNLKVKLASLQNENESLNTQMTSNGDASLNKAISPIEKQGEIYSTEKPKKKERSREREHLKERERERDKRKDDSSRTSELKRRSPEDYKKKNK